MAASQITKVLSVLDSEVQKWRAPVMDLHETHEGDPFRILVGTMLSARTKDETTVVVCKRLFKKVRGFKDLRSIDKTELETLIYPVGFYKTKARHLKEMAIIVKDVFHDKVPTEIDDLVKLPGVGRKTANLVISLAFAKDGVTVDTHVHRIMNRLGYVKTRTPHETEMALRRTLPRKWWSATNRILVAYGQHTCTPINPKCSECPVYKQCKRIGVMKSR